jgi:IclR family mhp operon transcriptional activator
MPDARSNESTEKDIQYKEVRGLTRGLELLRALNRMPGGFASTSELARICGIHRTTTKRLLETLRAEGVVRTGARDGQYHLNDGVRQLSDGFRHDRWISQVATPLMRESVRELLWPSDLATMEAGWMIVRESTHRWSMLSQHHAMPGERMPLLHTALGRAYLAACTDDELDSILCYLDQNEEALGIDMKERANVHQTIENTRARGFAMNQGEWSSESRFSAVGVPVFSAGQLLGAINLVFPKNAIRLEEMEARYVPKLKSLALKIGAESAACLRH